MMQWKQEIIVCLIFLDLVYKDLNLNQTVMKGKTSEQLQSQLREQFELAYKQKIKTMYGMFELKYQTLNDSILSVFERIKKDELLSTMFNDRTTSVHLQQRVRQIFSQVVAQQRQFIFKKLGTQIANLKFENEELVRQMKRLKESSQHLEKDFYTERITFEQAKNNTGEELRRVKEQNYGLQMQRKNMERELQQLKRKVQQLTQQNYQMKELLSNLRENKDSLQLQNKELNFYKGQIKNLQGEVQELKGNLIQSQKTFDRKYQNKKKQFKLKIEEYKSMINEMRMNRMRTESTVKNQEEVQMGVVFEKKLASVVRQGERKLSQLRSMKERELGQLQKKYQFKIKEMQTYFQKMLQSKILQIEQNTTVYFERMKQQGSNMQRRIQMYEQNYISVAEFEEEIDKRQELIMMMKKKLQELETCRESGSKNEQIILNKLREGELMCSQYKQKAYQLEEINAQITNKIKSYEQTNNIFKINEKRIKQQFEEYERINKKMKEENQQLKRQKIHLQQTVGQYQNNLRQRDRKIKEGHQQLQLLQKKVRKNIDLIQTVSRQRQSLLFDNNELKKQISNLQYKVKDLQMNMGLMNGGWQSKLSSLQLQLKNKGQLMGELQSSYQQMCHNYQQEKKKNYQIENELKKYEMESKFYKESSQMHKTEHETAIEQSRKVINEKNQKIEMLQIENQNKQQRIRLIQNQQSVNNDKMYVQNKLLKSKLQQISKLIEGKLQNMRKESRWIKEYLESRSMILKNDQAVLMSTFYKQLMHCSIYNQKQKESHVKKIKEEIQNSYNNDVKLVKNQFQDRIRQINDRNQFEKNSLKLQIKNRDDKIEQYSKQLKKSQIEAKKEKQECKNMQKQNQILSMKLQKEKEHIEQRIQQLTKQMKDEKDLILKQYSDRKNQMDQEIAELIATIKRLKTQTQLIQSKHQQEKLVIQAQLRTVRQQEEAIQKISYQKDIEMQKYQKQCQNAQEIKKNLENQIRGYADTLNKKIQLIHQLQLKENQTLGDLNLIRTKFDRISQENSELKRKFTQREEQFEEASRLKVRMEGELREIKGALNRSSKNNQLRSLNQLSMSTLQLSQKVNEMRKVNTYLDSKTPLRS